MLDVIGYTTAPEDFETLQARLPNWLEWLFSTPWPVPAVLMIALTAFVIWISWPRPDERPKSLGEAIASPAGEAESDDIDLIEMGVWLRSLASKLDASAAYGDGDYLPEDGRAHYYEGIAAARKLHAMGIESKVSPPDASASQCARYLCQHFRSIYPFLLHKDIDGARRVARFHRDWWLEKPDAG